MRTGDERGDSFLTPDLIICLCFCLSVEVIKKSPSLSYSYE